jgi:Flp pilus assembly pilin Flp
VACVTVIGSLGTWLSTEFGSVSTQVNAAS